MAVASAFVALSPDSVDLDGTVAIVTGGAVGIGRACAEALAAFGATVAVCDRDELNLAKCVADIEADGGDVYPGVLDVRDGDAVRTWVDEVVDRFGTIEILVNNAGGGFAAEFLDVTDNGQDALVRENFQSVTNFVRTVVPHMGETGGSIINITSIEAHRAAPGYAVYSAMKAAVANLTQTLALELGGRFIRVNAVAPGLVDTESNIAAMKPTDLKRWTKRDDIAQAVVFLASDASAGITGQVLQVTGWGI